MALLDAGCDEDQVTQVICGLCIVQFRHNFETAGRAFHAVYEKPKIEAKRKGGPSKKGAKDDDDVVQEGKAAWKNKRRKEGGDKKACSSFKLSHLLEGVDLYKLLEVSESATEDQIKKQYRKLVLQYHPDKQQNTPDAAGKEGPGLNSKEQHFIKIQEAYEIVSNETKRRQYDSTREFDDDVPEEIDESIGYYATFKPVFERNGRFSERLPVPDLGDETTDIAKVHKFFDFWFNFESWRDFSSHDEFNPEDAESRDERRWMEANNKRDRKPYVEAERRRLLKLAETAERLDPRLRAEREAAAAKKREEKERRARLKQEEEDAKLRAVEERRQKEEREKAELEEKERLEREQRKQSKQVEKALRQRAKKAVQGACKLDAAEMEEFQDMCLSLEAEDMEALCGRMDKLPSKKPAAEAAVRAEVAAWRKKQAGEKEEQAKQREEARLKEKQEAASKQGTQSGKPWVPEEMSFLAKGLVKFPGGVAGRWAVIAQFLETSGYSRTEKEVVTKVKEMSEGQSLRSMGSQVAQDLSSYKTPEAAKEAAATAAATAAAKASARAGAYPANAPTSPASKAAAGPKAAASPKAESTAEAKAEAKPAAAAADTAEWSAEQQKALEVALIKHPATLDKNERWRLIAEDVPGKTKSHCVARFKFLREQLVAQKK